jgi:GNAT superfamily N-acetyltransferase
MTLDRSFSDKISDSIYYGMILKDKIIGVNSVHQIEDTVRSRGLWVNPEFRKRGFGVELLEYGIMMAEGTTVWSYPRIEAVGVYKRAGFTVCSEEIVDNIDHKVNIYVKHETDNSLI